MGALVIHAFGVLVFLGILMGVRILRSRARCDDLDPELAIRPVSWVLTAGFLGARSIAPSAALFRRAGWIGR